MPSNRNYILAILFIAPLMLSCTKNLNFTQHRSPGNGQEARVLVGDYISIRSIERVEGDERKPVFNGYLGTGDQFMVDPGQYHLSTKLEFSESESSKPNTTSTAEIRTTAIDSLFISLEAGKTYQVSNKFSSHSKWAPEIHHVPTATPSK
jgi:hypothetical protein